MREPGFYWVKFNGVWTIARYYDPHWDIFGDDRGWQDGDLEEIDKFKIEREDPFSEIKPGLLDKPIKFPKRK